MSKATKNETCDTAVDIAPEILKASKADWPDGKPVIVIEGGLTIQVPCAPQPSSNERTVSFRHSDDYRCVHVNGRTYTFGPMQAKAVQILHEASLNGTPEVSGAHLMTECESDGSRFADLFRRHPAWRKFIDLGDVPGTYRLNLPVSDAA